MKELKTKLDTVRRSDGFTIIEVMIVLAIAGIIMLIVLLTVPALQRNSRNTQRRNDVGHLAGLMNEFASNNSGSFPATIQATGGSSTILALGSEKFAFYTTPTNAAPLSVGACTSSSCVAATTNSAWLVYTNADCSGAGGTLAYNASARAAAISWMTEGSNGNTLQCTTI